MNKIIVLCMKGKHGLRVHVFILSSSYKGQGLESFEIHVSLIEFINNQINSACTERGRCHLVKKKIKSK